MLTHWLPMTSILFAIVRICSYLFTCNYLKNKKLFLKFLFRSWTLRQILIIFEKKIIVIANIFRKLKTVKDLVKALSWKRRFRTSINSQQVNGCQTLVKSGWEHFHHIFSSLWEGVFWKIPPLLNFEIWGVFVNELSADEKYPVRDYGNLQIFIQIQLS